MISFRTLHFCSASEAPFPPGPRRRELVLNPIEAKVARTLFTLYDDLGNLRLVEVEAARLGLHPKSVFTPSGHVRGVSPFTRGQLHYLLTNPVYIGRSGTRTRPAPDSIPRSSMQTSGRGCRPS